MSMPMGHTATQASLPGYRRLDRRGGGSGAAAHGLPLWEVAIEPRQADYRASAGTAHSALWGRHSAEFVAPAVASVAFLPPAAPGGEADADGGWPGAADDGGGGGGGGGELWLRTGARGPRKRYGPIEVSYALRGKVAEAKWRALLRLGKKEELPGRAEGCTFTLDGSASGETFLVLRDPKGEAVAALSAERCTLQTTAGDGGDGSEYGLAFTGPGLRRWLGCKKDEASGCKLVLYPGMTPEPQGDALDEMLQEWVDVIQLAPHPRYEWRRLINQKGGPVIHPIEVEG